MGCFFDDVTHLILGFNDNAFQDIYHFSVGRHVEDRRLTTLPPYYHLKKGKLKTMTEKDFEHRGKGTFSYDGSQPA
ncbi:MAG TPA: hypothetical protein VFG09_13770 [Thermodesulfovibrionales bacterium]|nr:hypothetical protein [Thermodesulfovibrionales bacterium]